MTRPLAVDLFTGLHGFAAGLAAEGWHVVGFDIENMCAQFDVPRPEHVHLVIQDVLTLHGSQFKNADLIVASPPCQFFSYCAMPWSRAKKLAAEVRADPVRLEKELALFNACFRIQREACEAAGHHIPLIVENVRGAIPWVGRSRWNFGSFHLWGDVPALMPVPGFRFDGSGRSFQTASVNGVKGSDGYERDHPNAFGWKKPGTTSKGPARKMASAMIAKIPLPLSRHIAAAFKPQREQEAA